MPTPQRLKEALIVSSLLTGVIAVSFYDVVFLNKTFKVTTSRPQALPTGPYGQEDNVPPFIPVHNMESAYIDEPLHAFVAQNLKQGILPFWNPHQACGFPIIGMMQLGIFYPLNFFLYFFPQEIGWDLLILSRFLIAGALSYWFMRVMGFKMIPALGTAITFILSGPMVLFQYHTVNDDLLLFLIFISLEYLRRNPSLRQVGFMSLCVALTFFAGHPEQIFLNNLYGFLFFCFRIWAKKIHTAPSAIKKSFIYLFSAYAMGIASAAVVLLPFLRNLSTEFWHYHPPNIGLDAAWVPASWSLAMFNPLIFKKTLTPDTFIFSEWWGGYVGIIPFALAFFSLFSRQKQKLNYFFGIMAFLIISKSFGLPYINWIGYLPIFDLCNLHTHTYHIIAITISVLAGMGLRVILAGNNNFKKGLFYSAPLGIVFILYAIFFPKDGDLTFAVKGLVFGCGMLAAFQLILWVKDKQLLKLKHISVILILALFLELFLYIHRGRSKRFDSFAPAPYIEFLSQTPQRPRSYGILFAFFSNTASGYGVDDLGIALLILPQRFVNFVNYFLIENQFEKKSKGRSSLEVTPITFFPEQKPYLDMLNVKYTVAPPRLPPMLAAHVGQEGFPKLILSGKVSVYEQPQAMPRAYIVHRALFEPDESLAVKKIKKISPAFDKAAVLTAEPQPEILKQLAAAPVRDHSQAEIIKYSPNEVIIKAHLDNPGFLVLSDAYHPDWKAYVNGQPAKIFITNYLIRSVFLTQGEHEIRFVFVPMSFYYGLGISLISLVTVFGLIFLNKK